MSDTITVEAFDLETLDVDGAIREAEAEVSNDTRADFFRKAAVGGGAMIGGGVLLSGFPAVAAAGKPSRRQDKQILNYALLLELLEAAFYNRAVRNNILTGEVLATTKIVQAHENTHVKTLRALLGKDARKVPKFDFGTTVQDPNAFLKTAVVLEDTGVKAYSGQATRIFARSVVKAAVSILTVEARHAAQFRQLNGQNFAPRAFDEAKPMKTILRAVGKTGFIKS
jgi:rubrerythrin